MKFTSAELRLRRQVFRPPRPSSSPFWRRGRRLGRRRRRRCRRRRRRCFWKEEEGVEQKFGCKKLACLRGGEGRGGWLFFSSLFLTRCLSSPPLLLPALSILSSSLSPRRRGEIWGHPVAAAAAAVKEGWRGPRKSKKSSCEKIFFLFRSTKIRLKIECFSVWKIFVDGLKKSV